MRYILLILLLFSIVSFVEAQQQEQKIILIEPRYMSVVDVVLLFGGVVFYGQSSFPFFSNGSPNNSSNFLPQKSQNILSARK